MTTTQDRACNAIAKLHDIYTDHHDAEGRILPADQPYFVSDLLADLRHYCDAHGIDFTECNARGEGYYEADISEE